MYCENVLDGANSLSVHIETLAWLSVVEELTSVAEEIDSDRREEARKLIAVANKALRSYDSKSVNFTDTIVVKARQHVISVLEFFPEMSNLVDSVFFVTVSSRSIEEILDRTEELDLSKLTKKEKKQIKNAFESTLNTFNSKLEEMEQELDDSDASDSHK